MSKYELKTLSVGPIGTNCYILISAATKKALVIDPGAEAQRIKEAADQAGADIAYILNTHGHWDHISGNIEMKNLTKAPLLIHELDAPRLSNAALSGALSFGGDGQGGQAERQLKEGDIISVGDLELSIIHTPGHTPGCICLLCEDLLFTGDTLFQLSVGRTDLAGGDESALMKSLVEKISHLDPSLQVLPGHGPASRLDYELKYNPYFPR